MTCDFMSFLTVFQSWDNGKAGLELGTARSSGMLSTYRATRAPRVTWIGWMVVLGLMAL